MHCVVTGVAGFVGSSLADRLLKDGHSVRGIDSFVEYYPRPVKERNIEQCRDHSKFSFVEDSLIRADLTSLCEGADVIFHQAGQAGVRASWGNYFDSYTENNIGASQRLLEHVKSLSRRPKIVYASSSSVYGNAESLPTSEEVRPQPVSPYGVTKLAAEHLMSLYATEFGVHTVSLRYFTVFGPRQRPDMAFNRFIRGALQGQELSLYGDGEQSRDFTFIDDIVEANILAAQKGGIGRVYNVGGGCHATVNEVLSIIEKSLGTLKVKRDVRQKGDALHTGANTSRVQKELGFVPKVGLKEGIQAEITWMQSVLNDR